MKGILIVFLFHFCIGAAYSQAIYPVQLTSFDNESYLLKNKTLTRRVNELLKSSLLTLPSEKPVKIKLHLGKPKVLEVTSGGMDQPDSKYIYSTRSFQVAYSIPVKIDVKTDTDSLIYTYTSQSPVEYFSFKMSSGNENATVGDYNVPRPTEQEEDLVKQVSKSFTDYKNYNSVFMKEIRDKTDVFLSGFLKQFKQSLAAR